MVLSSHSQAEFDHDKWLCLWHVSTWPAWLPLRQYGGDQLELYIDSEFSFMVSYIAFRAIHVFTFQIKSFVVRP